MGPRRLLAVSGALALSVAAGASGAGGSNGEDDFTFYPQAGILWQDPPSDGRRVGPTAAVTATSR
jgi:hypothetical protein